MQHLGEICWAQRSRGKCGRNAYCVKARRDFQTAGLNGVFGYFCRRGQKYPAPGRGISLWTIPPSTLRVDTSATLRRTTQCEHWAASQREARGTDSHASDVGHWLGMTGYKGRTGSSAPTEQRKGCGGETAGRCTPRVLASLRGHRPLRNDRRKPVCRGGVLPRPFFTIPPSRLRRDTSFPLPCIDRYGILYGGII